MYIKYKIAQDVQLKRIFPVIIFLWATNFTLYFALRACSASCLCYKSAGGFYGYQGIAWVHKGFLGFTLRPK